MRPAPRTVLVVVTRQIGDVLLTTPLLRRARQLWPQARLDVLGFEGTLAILRGNPDVDALVPVAAGPGWGALPSLARRIWRRYDLAVVAEISDRAHLAGWLASRQRTGLLPPGEEGRRSRLKRSLLTHSVVSAGDRGDVHVVQEKLQLLEPWASGREGISTIQLRPPKAQPLPLSLQRALAPGGYVVVHAPSMWEYKQWPVPAFSRLIAVLAGHGHQIVLTGGPEAGDRALVRSLIAEHHGRDVLDPGVLGFNELSSLLAGSLLYVGPDTSISHLAAATGIPVLAVFGPTNPQRWAPWPAGGSGGTFVRSSPMQQVGNVTLIQSTHACVPCGRAGCEDHRDSRSVCLMRILPERVAEAALKLLPRTPAQMLRDPG